MIDAFILAWHHLKFHRARSIVLIACLGFVVFLPIGLDILTTGAEKVLLARAGSTPLLAGAPGSRLELVLSSLYFDVDPSRAIPVHQATQLSERDEVKAIPLHVRFSVQDQPVVGTSLEYFEFRSLKFRDGRPFARIGDCVLGAGAANALGAAVGSTVMTTPEEAFDLAGMYPLRLRVTGILEENRTPDDSAVFIDLQTSWIMAGHGHVVITVDIVYMLHRRDQVIFRKIKN